MSIPIPEAPMGRGWTDIDGTISVTENIIETDKTFDL